MFFFNHFPACFSRNQKKNVRPQYIQNHNPVFTLKNPGAQDKNGFRNKRKIDDEKITCLFVFINFFQFFFL